MEMLVIGNHHKQAIIKLINCITNTNNNQMTNRSQNVMTIDTNIFNRLKQIIKVYESFVNKTVQIDSKSDVNNPELNENSDQTNDETDPKTDVRSWLTSNYDCNQLIEHLFSHWIQNIGNFSMDSLNGNNSEDKLWTITLLVLNIMYKMRNCLTEHKMMLELGWICLSELDSKLTQFKPNYNQILIVLQNGLNQEKKENKEELEECQQLSQEVKRLRQKIIELQRNIIKANKEKQVLGKRDNISKSVGRKQGSKANNKRKANQTDSHPEDEDDYELQTEGTESDMNRKRQSNGVGSASSGLTFNCDICPKTFNSSYRLQRHTYSHTGMRPYSCLWPACNRQFNDNYHLKRHMLSHTGEKPYICQSADCNKRFARSEDLRTHQKSHWEQLPQQIDFESNQSNDNNNDNNVENDDNNDNNNNNDMSYPMDPHIP